MKYSIKYLLTTFLSLFFLLLTDYSYCCTSAIFTGKVTVDGRPLIWKNRDTGELNNRVEFFKASKDIKYSFIALVNSPSEGGEAWSGTNEKGFSIMNTASYNLQDLDDNTKSSKMDREGKVMYEALATCSNLSDFETMLDEMKKPIGVEANFGVIDAEGGAAYYEVNNYRWTKLDVNDPKIAPKGYLVYTNHSFTGRIDEGMGYIRYESAERILADYNSKHGKIDPQWILNNLSRSYYNSLLDIDLIKNPEYAHNGWFIDQDFIPRRSTSAVFIGKGVNKGENPLLSVVWIVLGYAPVGVAVPLMVEQGDKIPEFMLKRSEEDKNCEMCDVALNRKKVIFSVSRGNGKNYFNFSKVWNENGSGYIQTLYPIENKIFEKFDTLLEKFYIDGRVESEQIEKFYRNTDFGL